jgi:hypothetical protein
VSAIQVRRFTAADVPAIQRLDARLAAAGVPHRIGCQDARADGDPSLDREPIIERLYVAAAGDEIRGGVWLKEQMFWSDEGPLRVGWPKYLIAESPVNGMRAVVPASLLFSLVREQPRLLALGMGGTSGPFARLLAAARWNGSAMPFFAAFVRPSRVLRNLSCVRTTWLRRAIADALSYSGLASAAGHLLSVSRAGRRTRAIRKYSGTVVDRFGDWADEVWEQCRDAYSFIAIRDSRAANALYPDGLKCLTRLRVRNDDGDVGWICARAIDAAGTAFERHFGRLKLGILTDGLAHPSDAAGVLDVGVRQLIENGVDLILMYQSHPAWCGAARRVGFLPAPSPSAFYRSPAIDAVLTKAVAKNRHCHLTWSDGDGPERIE